MNAVSRSTKGMPKFDYHCGKNVKILNVINSKVKLGTALSVYDTGVKLHFDKNM